MARHIRTQTVYVPVFGLWQDAQGNPRYSMLRVPGEAPTLARRLEQLRDVKEIEHCPLAELLSPYLQVCQAMANAHDQGIVHRDLKPNNPAFAGHGARNARRAIRPGSPVPLLASAVIIAADTFGLPRDRPACRIRFVARKSAIRTETRVSATVASRRFSRLLDDVGAGRRFLVHRHGKVVCLMAPPPVRGRRASECLARLRGRSGVTLDDEFGADLLEHLSREDVEERRPWDS